MQDSDWSSLVGALWEPGRGADEDTIGYSLTVRVRLSNNMRFLIDATPNTAFHMRISDQGLTSIVTTI